MKKQALAKHEPKAETVETVLRPQVGYYRSVIDDERCRDLCAGAVVYVNRVDNNGTAHYIYRDNHYVSDLEEFTSMFVSEPNGEAIKAAEIEQIKTEIDNLVSNQDNLAKQLSDFSPHVTDTGNIETGTAMVPITNNPIAMKRAVATFRNETAKLKKGMTEKQRELKIRIDEQAAIIKSKIEGYKSLIGAKVQELEVFIKRAEKAIWTINLYLGKDEEIHQIAKGKPAPADTIITIRQLVLFMDEECAINADNDGIDARQIADFDHWLTNDPKHLQQVMPEPKGVVVLKPRRNMKPVEDPWLNAQLEIANRQTYFLIRNGESLYRICTDFNVNHTMFPTADEFTDVFYDKEKSEPHKPGSKAYMDAMDDLDSTKQHYYRVALIFQGLMDRTKVFHPLPFAGLNILNQDQHNTFFRFVYDAEPGTLLGPGRPDFKDWLADANQSLGVGQRIVGHIYFSYGSDRYSSDNYGSRSHRIWPSNADLPKSEQLYTLERKNEKNTGFYFYYERKEKIYRRWVPSGEPETRARCLIYPTDKFILNFDAPTATVENMEYYVNSRINRHQYADMLPILTRAIALKKQEAASEAPFRLLLIGQIMSAYKLTREQVEPMITELITWWKFKNQTHRALLSDDESAIKMIVAEFGLRQKRQAERLGISSDPLVNDLVTRIRLEEPNVMLIAHRAKNEYAALIAHNDSNVHLKEQIWSINRSSNCPELDRIKLKSTKEWCTADSRSLRWQALFEHERWKDWIRDVRKEGHLTGPEIAQALEQIPEMAVHYDLKMHGRKKPLDFLPMGMSLMHGIADTVYYYYCDTRAELPTKDLLNSHISEPKIGVIKVKWTRTASEGTTFKVDEHYHICIDDKQYPWRVDYAGGHYASRGRAEEKVMIREWPDNIDLIEDDFKQYKICYSRSRILSSISSEADRSVREQLEERFYGVEFAKYMDEFGDPELWEEHKQKLNPPKPDLPEFFERVTDLFIGNSISCNGLTVGELYERLKRDFARHTFESKEYHWGEAKKHKVSKIEMPKPEIANLVITHREIPPYNPNATGGEDD